MVQNKKVQMNAETGKVGSSNQKPLKSFGLNVELNNKGQLMINQGGEGFNDYEIIGFLETIKSSMLKQIVERNFKKP